MMNEFVKYFLSEHGTTEHDSFEIAEDCWIYQQSKIDALLKHIKEQDLRIKRLIESEENIARGCEEWRNAHRKAEERAEELQLKLSEESRILHNVIDIEYKKRDELQKRMDAALEVCKNKRSLSACLSFEVEQAIKGGGE